MTVTNAESIFLSLAIPDGHFTFIVGCKGKEVLASFSQAYSSRMKVDDTTGTLSGTRFPDDLSELLGCVHGEPLTVRYVKGGTAFLDYIDDSLVLILPMCAAPILRSVTDVSAAYNEAIREQEMLRKMRPSSAATKKFDELMERALRG